MPSFNRQIFPLPIQKIRGEGERGRAKGVKVKGKGKGKGVKGQIKFTTHYSLLITFNWSKETDYSELVGSDRGDNYLRWIYPLLAGDFAGANSAESSDMVDLDDRWYYDRF